MKVPKPADEAQRLAILYEHNLLDTPSEQDFDDLVRLAAQICGTPIAAVSLIDEHRQWFKAITGLNVAETGREIAFCAHTILQEDLMIVSDTEADPRFAANPLVTSNPHIRFYAGAPLFTEEGYALGSLCVIDQTPRKLTADQEETLRLLARQASSRIKAARQMAERERLLLEKERLVAEREQAEAALASEREFTQALLESLHDGIVACDAQGTLTLFNRTTRELHGLSEQPLPPETWAEHFDLYDADGLTPMRMQNIPLFRALQGETVIDAEMVVAPAHGPSRTLLASGRPILDAAGTKLGAVAAMHDITARKQMEREMGRLAAIIESSEEAIIAGTVDGLIVSWNSGAEKLYGYAASEMLGQHSSVLAQEHEKRLGPGIVARLVGGVAVEPMEVIRTRKDGSALDVSLSFSPIRDAEGVLIGVSCISRDITARKKAETALAETHARLRAVLEGAPIILYAADTEGTVTLSEGTGLASLGLKPGEAVGLSVFDFSGGDPVQEEPMRRALAGETVSYDVRYESLYLHTELRPLRDETGTVTGIIGVCFDVTERSLAEERFRLLFEQSSDAHLLCGGGKVIDCNDATLALMRCSDKEQLLAVHPATLSPEYQPDGKRSAEKGLEMEALARERSLHRFEWIHRTMDGEDFPAEVALTPVTLGGDPVMLAVLHDLTERKRAEELIRDHAIVLEFQKQELEKTNAELEQLATTDGLTGLKNHRAFQERLAEEVSRATRYGTQLSLVMLDVDYFKKYNDMFGHPAGDDVLRTVAGVMRRNARDTDTVARYGGEEFVLILPQTDGLGAIAVAERIRRDIAETSWPLRAITASFGVAFLGFGMDSGKLVAQADAALYDAKAGGRNQVAQRHSPAEREALLLPSQSAAV